jgi:Acyl-CoA carboxylase epsilon subunit
MEGADVVVLRGAPDDVELAALLTVLAALRAAPKPQRENPRQTPSWTRPTRYRPAGAWTSR